MTSATTKRRILVTSALPYANGQLHLGHLLEHIQTDIWVRFQRLRGNECYYVCADDTHGTAIMLKADEQGITPETLIDRIRDDHIRDFQGFNISHDNYYSTHSEENKFFSEAIYKEIEHKGYIAKRDITQAFDPEKKLFLADRYIKGKCPKCGAEDQYGDNCEKCGATYSPTDLVDPYSTISGAKPIDKESEHYFFKLPDFHAFLDEWLSNEKLQPAVANKLREWLDAGLQEWDISRDAPYFGFNIPDTEDKYFYVWLDAPIGYMASFKNFCDKQSNLTFDDFWHKDSNTELYHFIGKDIINFHGLFWPAMLSATQFRIPTSIFAHGFVTVDGAKMSKSRGTFITASSYLEAIKPDYLRYYFASRLGSGVEDIDLNLEEFRQKCNADLVGKLVNIASRCAGFITKRFEGKLASEIGDGDTLLTEITEANDSITQHYEQREFGKAVKQIMALTDKANQYIDDKQPWVIAKSDQESDIEQLQQICSTGIVLFAEIVALLKPVVPALGNDTEAFLGLELSWTGNSQKLLGSTINKFKPLLKRLEETDIAKLVAPEIDSAKPATKKQVKQNKGQSKRQAEADTLIGIEDFTKVDLRIAKIVAANDVEGADKLLQLTLDVGQLGQRQVFSGIKSSYSANDLVGRLTVLVANLQPRKMRFGVSEGMILAAGDKEIYLLDVDNGAKPGMKVS